MANVVKVPDDALDRDDDNTPELANEGSASRANEPSPLLGVSRAPELQNVSLWLALKMWFQGVPQRKPVNLPRPPRSVLAARTPTIIGPEDEAREARQGRLSGRR